MSEKDPGLRLQESVAMRELTKEDERRIMQDVMTQNGTLELFAGSHAGHGNETFTPVFGKDDSQENFFKLLKTAPSGQVRDFVENKEQGEGVLFMPARLKSVEIGEVVESVDKRKGLLGFLGVKKVNTLKIRQKVPETMRNPLTGEDEPAVNLIYRFKADFYDEQTKKAGNGVGAQVRFGTQLPESMANELKAILKEDPKAMRDIVDGFVEEEGRSEDWNTLTQFAEDGAAVTGEGPAIWRRRPQYDLLPEDWKVTVLDTANPSVHMKQI